MNRISLQCAMFIIVLFGSRFDRVQALKVYFDIKEEGIQYVPWINFTCSWTYENDTQISVIIYKLNPRRRIVSVKMYPEIEIEKCYDCHWDEDRMNVSATDCSVTVEIYEPRCRDGGTYSCKVNREVEVQRKIGNPSNASPYLAVFPLNFQDGVSATPGQNIKSVCSAEVGNHKTLNWSRAGTDALNNFGIEGDNINTVKFYDGCSTLERSTLIERSTVSMSNTRSICEVVDIDTSSGRWPCSPGPHCVVSEFLQVYDELTIYNPRLEPVKLANVEFIKPMQALTLTCDADAVLLPIHYSDILSLQLMRVLPDQTILAMAKFPEDGSVLGKDEFHSPFQDPLWDIIFTESPYPNTTRPRKLQVTINETDASNFGLYVCAVGYLYGTRTTKYWSGWQYLDIQYLPEKPLVTNVEVKKMFVTGDYSLTADCSAFVGLDRKLTWYLRAKNGSILSFWPLYAYAWPRSIESHIGVAYSTNVEERPDTIGGTLMNSTLRIRIPFSLNNANVSCTSQNMMEPNATANLSLWTSFTIKLSRYQMTQDTSDDVILFVVGACAVVVSIVHVIAGVCFFLLRAASGPTQRQLPVPQQSQPLVSQQGQTYAAMLVNQHIQPPQSVISKGKSSRLSTTTTLFLTDTSPAKSKNMKYIIQGGTSTSVF